MAQATWDCSLTGIKTHPLDASIQWLLSEAPPNGELRKKGMRDCEIQDEELPPTLRLVLDVISQCFYKQICIKTSARSQLTRRSETEEAEDEDG